MVSCYLDTYNQDSNTCRAVENRAVKKVDCRAIITDDIRNKNAEKILHWFLCPNVGQASTNRNLAVTQGFVFLDCDIFTSFSHLKSSLLTTHH